MSMLNRMILWELIKIFVLSLIGITAILVLAVVVIEAQNQGLAPLQILAVIPLVIPYTLPYTIPATTLFATCVVYGRVAHDNEILAIKAAGINVLHVVRPALFLGATMSVTTAGLYYYLIPTSNFLMKTVFLQDLEAVLYGYLKQQGRFSHPKLDYVIFVQRVEGKKLLEAQFMHRDPSGTGFDVVARAREAELLIDNAHKKVHVHMRQCWITGSNGAAYVDDKVWPVDFPPDFGDNRKQRRSDMTWRELDKNIAKEKATLAELDAKIALTAAMLTQKNGPENLPAHLDNLRNQRNSTDIQVCYLVGEKHKRLAIAAGCFCFVLVGCPVGIWFSRSDYLSAFVTCFMPIVLIYYPLIICGDNLARTGQANPFLALWPANVLMVVIGLGMYWKLLKN